jgi:catechol 2,3-dioxygenase-like lactoylglutathione lyase family enzyme
MTSLPAIWLDHVNLPAKDPERLCAWYATKLGLQTDGNIVRGPGIAIAFTKGTPVSPECKLHFGLRAESHADVEAWAQHFGVGISIRENDFFAARVTDPEGNVFEIYWDKH